MTRGSRNRRQSPKTNVAGRFTTVVITVLLYCESSTGQTSTLVVDANFPSGSATIVKLDQEKRVIRINPQVHEKRGWACWWYFKVSGVTPGETLTIDVGKAPWATPTRATCSLDGVTWEHTEPGTREGGRIVYRHKLDAAEAWFAWGPPFTVADAQRLVDRIANESDDAESFVLCTTKEGRPTPALKISSGAAEQKMSGVWVQARQHAWESGSSHVAKGFVRWLVSDEPAAVRLRSRAVVMFVPVMDIDNVYRGAGGKNQSPHDHNRDWSAKPVWKSVAAAQQLIGKLDRSGRFDLFIDLHNPGANDPEPFFFVPPRTLLSPAGIRNLDTFVSTARRHITGPLAFRGKTRVSGAGYDNQWKAISKNWVALNTSDHTVAVTLETSWNTPASTVPGYERVGRELGKAVEEFLKHDIRKPVAEDDKAEK